MQRIRGEIFVHPLNSRTYRLPSIVFSFFKKTLDRMAQLLSLHGLKFERVDGSVPIAKRRRVLDEFEEGNISILLVTLGTGAVG